MNTKKKSTKPFSGRAFVAIGTLIFFACLIASGAMLQATDHRPYTFWKIFAKAMHNFAAIAFTAFAIAHIAKNWKAMKSHITKAKNVRISKEMAAGLTLLTLMMLACLLASYRLMIVHNI